MSSVKMLSGSVGCNLNEGKKLLYAQNECNLRGIFNTRVQKTGETFDLFYTELYYLAKACVYDNFVEQMFRDRIVCGISNKGLQHNLLREAKLTLKDAVDICRGWDATKAQARSLQTIVPDKAHVGHVFQREGDVWLTEKTSGSGPG